MVKINAKKNTKFESMIVKLVAIKILDSGETIKCIVTDFGWFG